VFKPFIGFRKAYDSVTREVLYNIFIEFGIPMILIRLIKLCLNKTYSRFRVGDHLSDMFPFRSGLKRGDSLSPLFLNFALEYAIRRVRVNQVGLKLNGIHHILVYADGVNILGGSVYTIKEKAEALIVASKETGLEVYADTTKYIIMSRDQNAQDKVTIWKLKIDPLKGWKI